MLRRIKPIVAVAMAYGALGCGAEDTPPTPPAPACADPNGCERPNPSPYDPDLEGEVPTAGLSPEDAAELLPDLLVRATSFSPDRFLTLYQGLLQLGDDTCPGAVDLPSDPGETNVLWVADCQGTDGTAYYGYVQETHFDRTLDDGTEDQGVVFLTGGNAMHMIAPDGRSLEGTLYFEYHTLLMPDGSTQYYGYKQGDLVADDASADGDPWLSGEIGGTYNFFAYDYEGYRALLYNGTFSLPHDPRVRAVELTDMSVDDLACPISALGGASLRDTAGSWHDATFGDTEDLGTNAECNACADLSFGSEDLGSFCEPEEPLLDLLAWETKPW